MIFLPQPLFIPFAVLELELVQAEQEKINSEIQYEMVQSPLDTAHKIKGFYSFRKQQNYLDVQILHIHPAFCSQENGGQPCRAPVWSRDMAGPKRSAAFWDLTVAPCAPVMVTILPNSFYLATVNLVIFREIQFNFTQLISFHVNCHKVKLHFFP